MARYPLENLEIWLSFQTLIGYVFYITYFDRVFNIYFTAIVKMGRMFLFSS